MMSKYRFLRVVDSSSQTTIALCVYYRTSTTIAFRPIFNLFESPVQRNTRQVPRLTEVEYEENLDVSCIGFPANWFDLLSQHKAKQL